MSEVKEFNDGGVKGEMVNPSNSALEKLFSMVPKEKFQSQEDDEAKRQEELEAAQKAVNQNNQQPNQQQDDKNKNKQTTATDLEEDEDGKNKQQQQQQNKTQQTQQTQSQQQQNQNQNQNTDDVPVIKSFIDKFGDVEGEFEDTDEGLMNYFETVLPNYVEEGKKMGVTQLFEELPLVGELANHLAKGYGIDSFLKKQEIIDYSKLEIKEDDTATQEKFYRQALKAVGNSDEDIDDLVETAKDSGKLFAKSKAAVSKLDTLQRASIEDIQKAEKAENDRIEKENKETLKKVDSIISSGKIGGLQFPKEDMDALRAFGTVVDKDGYTARDKKWSSLTLEQQLLLDLILMKDFKSVGAKSTEGENKAKSLARIKTKAGGQPRVDMNVSSTNNDILAKAKGDIKSFLGNTIE